MHPSFPLALLQNEPFLLIALRQEFTRFPKLHAVYPLLRCADGEGEERNHVRPGDALDDLDEEDREVHRGEGEVGQDRGEEMSESDRGLVVVHEVERNEEEFVPGAKDEKRRLKKNNGKSASPRRVLLRGCETHAVVVVGPEDPALLFRDGFMRRRARDEGSGVKMSGLFTNRRGTRTYAYMWM